MEKELETYLEILNSERCQKKPKDSIIIVNKITKCFTQEMSQFTMGLLIDLLLNEKNALFTFIRKMSFQHENIPAVSAAFKLLEHLVTNLTKSASPYFPLLYQKCLIFFNAKYAKIKEVSLKLIRSMLATDTRVDLDLPKLVSALEKYLEQQTKIPGTVLEQVYGLLGYFFEKHPEILTRKKWFLKKMLETLQEESRGGKSSSISAVKGVFEGINSYLMSYSLPDQETVTKTYEYIKAWSNFREDKRAASRAALKILQNHWSRFSKLIYCDKEFWKINMEVWITQEKEDREMSFKFLCAFYSVIALFIKQQSDDLIITNQLKEFIGALDSKENSYMKKAALVGIKLFVLTESLTGRNFNMTYDHVVEFVKKQEMRKFVSCLPHSVECLSAFVSKSPNENLTEELAFLRKLSVKLINMYPNVEPELQKSAVVALEKSFYMLGLSSLQVMETHIEKVLYLGLIRTCSLMTYPELELLKEREETVEDTCYKSYLSLWKYLLTLTSSPNLPVGGSFNLKKGIAVMVFDVFLKSFLKIISKLNFNINEKMEVENPSDLHIFINIVDLYEDLMKLVDPFCLQKWLMEILKNVIELSNANPLVSGFYKIIKTTLQIADSIEFFTDITDKEKEKCAELVRTFVEEVLTKVNHFKGDLQLACLKVLLATPVTVLEDFVENAIPALEVTIQLARSSPTLLSDLFETLERWDSHLSSDKIMEKILPHFDVFFQSPYFKGNNSVDWSKAGRKVKNQVIFNDSEFLTLQKNFLMFLGKTEMRKGLNMIELPETEVRDIKDEHLTIFLPFGVANLSLNAEEIILRTIDLAGSCGDRQTRISACELLHSLFMVMLGNVNQLTGSYRFLFKKTLTCCLSLGCDSDGIVSQIFEPLMYQVIHYFSSKKVLHFSETDDLIDILIEHVTSPFNAIVRDFAGVLLREFTIWSIKQLSPKELKETPDSMKRILEKIYSLALHPSYNKRLGAAVLFNKIYQTLREEDFIVNAYWFQLFYYFMESLRMCDGPEDVTEITDAIRHLERPLVENYRDFNQESPHRIVPPDFKGGRLCHLVRWTMERACDAKAVIRHTVMRLVEVLAPLVENCDANMSFASKQFHQFFQYKETLFEVSFNEEEFLNWLKYQIAGFEYCAWLLKQKVLSTEEVFQPKFKAALKRFITGILATKKTTKTVDGFKRQCILSYITLLYALRERAVLFPSEHWDLLKKVVTKPSEFGFDLNRPSSTDQLSTSLIALISYFFKHLSLYDWNNFFQNLETVIVAPVFSCITKRQIVSLESLEFLFTLKIIESSGIWKDFVEKVLFSMQESLFLVPIFNALFQNVGDSVHTIVLDPYCRLYLEEILEIILRVSPDLSGVMNCLENEEDVIEEETGKIIKKGEYFQVVFKNPILKILKCKFSLFLDWVLTRGNPKGVKLLLLVLENYSGNLECALDLFTRWEEFKNLNIPNATLLQLAVSGVRHVGAPGFLKFSPIADKIYDILKNRNLFQMSLTEIELVFTLFPFLSMFGEGVGENEKLADCLSKFLVEVDAFNQVKDSFIMSHCHLAFSGFLQSLKMTASLVVFKFVLERSAWFSAVCQKEDIESALSVFGESRVSLSHTITALELAYKFCFENKTSDFPLVHKLFLDPLMRVAPSRAVLHLVEEKMENLCDIVTSYWKDEKSSIEISVNMTRKICAAGVFQAFVAKVPKEDIDEMSKEKRQLMVGMVRKVFLLLKQPYPPIQVKERYRKLMCEIFNMICCIVGARCSEEKFYKLFIFDTRGSFLFETIDKTLQYDFKMAFDELPKRKKHLTILRETLSRDSVKQDSVKYIQTNTLFMSSLREDVTRFDLTFSFIRPMDSVAETTKNVEIELEMDSLNSHECMATLVATIMKLIQDKITPIDDVTEPPCWLKFFLSILSNSEFCQNLKLFILKAIYNVQDFVAGFCDKIFPDLLDAILKIFVNYPINYFLLDLIEMMLGWKHVPREERSQMILTEVVRFVIVKSDSLERSIVQSNLEIIKTMIEVWKDGLLLPKLSLLACSRLCKSIKDDMKLTSVPDSVTYLNLHVCGVLLSNGISAWEKSESRFFNVLVQSFQEESKINELCAEVCGLGLKHLEKTSSRKLNQIEELVQEKISTLEHSWLTVLYGIHKHYPRISHPFTFKIFSSAWDSNNSLIVKKLEMLLSHVSNSQFEVDATFKRHAGAFILNMLDSADVAVHEISLQIAEKLLDRLDNEKLKVFMIELSRLQRSGYSSVRKWVYEICKKLYLNGSPDVVKTCKVILLRGLNDGVEELEKSCLDFWRERLKFTPPHAALLFILKDMYASEIEEIFLSNAAKVLTQFADDFLLRKMLFPLPIASGCKFHQRNLILGSRQSFLLSSSRRTLTNQSLEHVATIRQQDISYQRPTINTLKFQPTVLENSSLTVVPKNPIKRRFYKNESRAPFRRKKNLEEVTKKQPEVKIYGEYRDGDYPYIQILNSQILKLLEVLSKKDHQIAKFFLISFYSSVIKYINQNDKDDFLKKLEMLIENIFKTSASFDPGVFGFLLRVLYNDRLNVDCHLISNAAISSNWVSLGALILEQTISNKEGGNEGVVNKRSDRETPEEKRWLELARLYRNLEEFDVLSGIFLDKLKVMGDAREAVRCETVWNWQDASKHYEGALRTKAESSEKEFYTESYLSCLAKLSNWSSLNKCIRMSVNYDLNDLWNNYNLLSWFLKSEMMISLGNNENEFKTILEKFCENNVRENILSTNFGEEMITFDWFSNNLQRANQRIDRLCLDFLAEWSHLDQWSYNLRAAKLSRLQIIAELSFAVKNLSEVSKTRLEQNIKAGVKRWETNSPLPTDDLTIWDVKLAYRREFLKHLKDFDLRRVEIKSILSLAKAALAQENLHMAKECLSKAKDKLSEEDFELKVEHNVCFNLGKMIFARMKMKNRDIGWEVYLNVWNGISKQITSAMNTDSDFDPFTYSCNLTLGQLVSEILPFVKKEHIPQYVLEALRSKLKSENEIAIALEKKALEYFETAVCSIENSKDSFDIKCSAYLELAKFFLKFPDSGSFEKLTKYILRAMRLGSQEARELFGCVLNVFIPENYHFDDVISECESVPSWMFIMWINQMLASLNSNLSSFLKAILIRIICDYPNAVRYALEFRRELKSDNVTEFLLEKLYSVSADRIYDDFYLSVKYLASPDLILTHYLKIILQKVSQPNLNFSSIEAVILLLKNFMFSPENDKFRGPIFKYWDNFKKPLENLIGLKDVDVLKQMLKDMVSSVETSKLGSKRMLGLLESYSPWLHNFHALKFDSELEIPGQYDGTRQPIKKYLVRTSSFRNSVVLFDSKCKPMRISILGNDAKEHMFLVKFGEDLRQDERIQQVFRHFNHRLKESARRFSIDTYKVVPLTIRLGMIEWVDNTVSLLEMIESSLKNESDAIAKAQTAHLAFLAEGAPLDAISIHLAAFENITREKAILNFNIRIQGFQRDLLKKSFLSLSMSPEHFIHLRGNFAVSHAITSVTHWLVGIGDRHLQNILVSRKTGRVLGIDFGYAFGFATQFLTPPELIPFRLTPQILNLMHPLEESGWIKQTMIHALRIYRKESFRLQSVLEVFVKEPVMDWLTHVKETPENAWQPRRKLELVKKKLSGANPVVTFEADLRAGHSESKHLTKYVEVLRGCPENNIRAKCGEEGLSEEEQVECLIDLARDPHVLAKTYIGWNPWL